MEKHEKEIMEAIESYSNHGEELPDAVAMIERLFDMAVISDEFTQMEQMERIDFVDRKKNLLQFLSILIEIEEEVYHVN